MTFAEIIIRKKQKETKTKVNRKDKTKLQHRKHENKNKVTNKETNKPNKKQEKGIIRQISQSLNRKEAGPS